jgi:hypothetical protein
MYTGGEGARGYGIEHPLKIFQKAPQIPFSQDFQPVSIFVFPIGATK